MNGYFVKLVVSLMNGGGYPVLRRMFEAHAAALRLRADVPEERVRETENAAENAAQDPREVARFTRDVVLPASPFPGLVLTNVGPFPFEATTVLFNAETEQYELIEVGQLCHMPGSDCYCQRAVVAYMADDRWDMISDIYVDDTVGADAEAGEAEGDDG